MERQSCLGLQIEHLANGIFIHQSAYTENVVKQFYSDKAHSLNNLMIIRLLEVSKDSFRPPKEGEGILGPEVLYLSIVGALMNISNTTRPDIEFLLNY